MAEIDLAAIKAKQQERLARATGKTLGPAGMPTLPAPAKPLPPGTRGQLPLPQGKVVGVRTPSSLTPMEREALESIGWTPDIPVPDNAAAILAEARQRMLATTDEVNLPLPIDPRTPPVEVDVKDIKQLSAAEQQRFADIRKQAIADLKAAAQQAQQAPQLQQQQAQMLQREAAVPGISAAMRVAQGSSEPLIEDDRPSRATSAPSTPAAPAVPPAAEKPAPEPPAASDTGAALALTHCPHCAGDLSMPGVPEPPYSDKIAFVHALLGQKPWCKEYTLLGGQLHVTFRTLTPGEVASVHNQVQLEREQGKLPGEIDFWERITWYRFFLQIQGVHGAGASGIHHDLPDALSADTNGTGQRFWQSPDLVLTAGETALPLVETYLMEHVFKTEGLFRVIKRACSTFNRLVIKMEAMVDNSDFWQPTEELP